ncbi:MAG: hypothetical protein FJX04_05075 [Alphaproteobacteria bacterium]|nr:hypothetical protein [Alphaproteobacteria bacterium]
MAETIPLRGDPSALTEYKKILKQVLDIRPSGTRQRLATALGKNRSFISQIANPAYPMPIPATHLDTLFDVCHFSDKEKRKFLDRYQQAHPGRLRLVSSQAAMRRITVELPDLGDATRNQMLETLFEIMARHLVRILDDSESKS